MPGRGSKNAKKTVDWPKTAQVRPRPPTTLTPHDRPARVTPHIRFPNRRWRISLGLGGGNAIPITSVIDPPSCPGYRTSAGAAPIGAGGTTMSDFGSSVGVYRTDGRA